MAAQRILIVSDGTAANELAARVAGCGYEVAGAASSGREATALAGEAQPDLVLMDLSSDDEIGGVEAAGKIQQWRPIPVIFLTASSGPPLPRARASELVEDLVQPFTDRELRLSIELALYKDGTRRHAREWDDRFFAVSIDMLCFLDFNGYFKRLNPAWEKTLGFTREELRSRPFIEFVHPDDRARTLEQNRLVRAGGHARSFQNRYVWKDGSYRWLLWNAAPDTDHRVIYSVARDITERRLAEEERELLVKELKAALAEVKTLQQILPICSYCKNIRNDDNYWETVETYISEHTNARFSHSICPTCYRNQVEPQFDPPRRK
jgi:PAS domain S-box-containing protein